MFEYAYHCEVGYVSETARIYMVWDAKLTHHRRRSDRATRLRKRTSQVLRKLRGTDSAWMYASRHDWNTVTISCEID